MVFYVIYFHPFFKKQKPLDPPVPSQFNTRPWCPVYKTNWLGSFILDNPITQHKVPKIFRMLLVANRPPRAPKRCIPVRVTLFVAWVVAVAVLFGNGWGKRGVGRESLLVQHHHTSPARHAYPVHQVRRRVHNLTRPLPVALKLWEESLIAYRTIHPYLVPWCESPPLAPCVSSNLFSSTNLRLRRSFEQLGPPVFGFPTQTWE